jgi:hypothetical protein
MCQLICFPAANFARRQSAGAPAARSRCPLLPRFHYRQLPRLRLGDPACASASTLDDESLFFASSTDGCHRFIATRLLTGPVWR